MRKQPNPSQSDARQDRIEEIRVLLCQKDLTTAQIEYLTGINTNSLRHYLLELEAKNYVTHTKLAVKGSPGVNLYRITADGRSVKPRAPIIAVEAAKPDHLQWWTINLGARND